MPFCQKILGIELACFFEVVGLMGDMSKNLLTGCEASNP